MTVYSPSQTAEWMRCPMARALRKEGWISKWGAKRDLAAIIGQSYAAGVGTYNNLRKSAKVLPARGVSDSTRRSWAESCVTVAKGVMKQRLDEIERLGLVLSVMEDDDSYMKDMEKRIVNAVGEYVLTDPMPDDWQIVDVEAPLNDAGAARPDLVIRNAQGLHMVDYKSKVQLLARYEAMTKAEYANSHQMLHYGHFGKLHYGEDLAGYYIGLSVFTPRFRVEWLPYPYNSEVLKTWAATMPSAWAQMEREDKNEALPYMAAVHSDRFGQCPYYKACFEHHYDPALMLRDYLYVERVNEESASDGHIAEM